jgi:monooxygenase
MTPTHLEGITPMTVEHVDVLIVGAGLAGIDAAYRLQTRCPNKSYAVLESRADLGGTWDLFRYPGIRSDSSMSTLGFPFRPWKDPHSIASGGRIADYIRDTAREFGIDSHIRYRHRVRSASWSSATALWTVRVEVGPDCAPATVTCDFFYVCGGYYDYANGYTPDLPGLGDFGGDVLHPQHWPEGYDYAGKRVVVIGSGATAISLVPALAATAGHVTMVQRSPTYIRSLPSYDPLVAGLHGKLPERVAAALLKWKGILIGEASYRFCRRFPDRAARLLGEGIAKELSDPGDVARHFTPRYKPWDQRLCMVPDADLFSAFNSGTASVVTDSIDTFTESGLRLSSGEVVEADVVVTATGLAMTPCGGIRIEVDGSAVDLGSTYLYRGVLLSDVPNFALCLGYSNASWTLRADISARYVSRLLAHMDRKGYVQAVPRRVDDGRVPRPALDLTSGYVTRGSDAFPKQGSRAPWVRTNYIRDSIECRFGRIGKSMRFDRRVIRSHFERPTTDLQESTSW